MVKKSKLKSKRTSKPNKSHKGLIAGLSIGGVVALIAGALVVMYFLGVFGDLFKKKSKPRVNDKRGSSTSNTDPSTMNLVDVPGFIDGQTDKTQPVLLGTGPSKPQQVEGEYNINTYPKCKGEKYAGGFDGCKGQSAESQGPQYAWAQGMSKRGNNLWVQCPERENYKFISEAYICRDSYHT